MKIVWAPLYLLILWMFISRYGKRVWIVLAFIPLLILLTDQGSVLIKNAVARCRPCHEPSLLGMVHIVRDHCGGMYGFVSSHAANSFGIAAFTFPLLGKKWYTWCIFVWALLISYSRVYLGVHYPGDVAGGALLGLCAGTGLALAAGSILKRR